MEPKISDFGIYNYHENDNVLLTIQKKALYIEPDYIFNENLSEKSDVFSFGMLLYCIINDCLLNTDDFWKSLSDLEIGKRPEFNGNEFYKNLLNDCWEQNPDKRTTFSKILSNLCENDLFIIPGSDINEIRNYQNKIIPNGFNVINQPKESFFLLLPPNKSDKNDSFEVFNLSQSFNIKLTPIYFSNPEPKINVKINNSNNSSHRESQRIYLKLYRT